MAKKRDHGGGLDAAIATYGGTRADWIDLSTGINPVPYPLPDFSPDVWTALPDQAAHARVIDAARAFWSVPDDLAILPSGGVSALIAALPQLAQGKAVHIPKPTYNEHEAAFRHAGFGLDAGAETRVLVHPNNPDGRLYSASDLSASKGLTILDESFCDVMPEASLLGAGKGPVITLKGLGKFWGLAGARLGFAIGPADLLAQLKESLGPWAVSGPALAIGAAALCDTHWAQSARDRLQQDADRLDSVAQAAGLEIKGGTSLFRLYSAPDSLALQAKLAQAHIWTRVFPYSNQWIRFGLPGCEEDWTRVVRALQE